MQRWIALTTATVVCAGLLIAAEKQWKANDGSRPQPRIVEPGVHPGDPPSDAIALFDGKDLSRWQTCGKPGEAPKWKVADSVATIAPGTGSIETKEGFGDCHLHVEWKADEGSHGNSGVFMQGQYEIQIYNSYRNKDRIYADGIAGAMYGQHPPLVNACREPGKWQSFDIVFHRPHFDREGKVTQPGTMTVLQNGVLVLDHAAIKGFTVHDAEAQYKAHPDKMSVMLQNHGDPVSFRNIWIRPLQEDE